MARPSDTQITSYFDQCQALIRDHGWMIQGVFPAGDDEHSDLEYPFCYTIGLTDKDMPELLMVGELEICHGVLNAVAQLLDTGWLPPVANGNLLYDNRGWKGELRVRGPVDDVAGGCPVHMARNYYAWAGREDPEQITVYQIEWPDPAGRYVDGGGEIGAVSPQLPLKLVLP